MLCLPPHTTHETQPLDCGVFGPLKSHWSNVCHTFFQKNPGKVITRFQFSALISEAWAKALCPANIIAGFRICGVFSFNPDVISVPVVEEVIDKSGEKMSDEQPTPSQLSLIQHVFPSSTEPAHSAGNIIFTEEQVEPFQRWYEEGFDVYEDLDYVRWLELHHPESLSDGCNSLIAASPDDGLIAEHFSFVVAT